MITAIDAGAGVPDTLRFIAVGGASVSPRLLNRASELGLPLYEGYGLSECSSVVALNSPQACRRSSVGKPLPHIRVELAEDGEILVRGNAFRGYVGEPPHDDDAAIGTGDLGRFDEDGFLYITGRKKTVFVTAYGRNVSPEWIERELCMEPVIAQAAVFGEAAPWNAAVVVPRTVDRAAIQSAIDRVNQTLPDYARVHQWISANAPFSHANDQATVNGRLRRSAIALAYGRRIRELYNEVHA
jgi:long-subunit acyl-CoA synthetase (AMP-forming)